jgi:hypothetical protein
MTPELFTEEGITGYDSAISVAGCLSLMRNAISLARRLLLSDLSSTLPVSDCKQGRMLIEQLVMDKQKL